jgi:predicted ArsR family transcriptional regulator
MSDDIEEEDFRTQAKVFKALQSEGRLRVLKAVSEHQPVSAPELHDEFGISKEGIKKRLNRLEEAGLLKSSRERGPGNRPRDEYVLAYEQEGVMVQLDVVPDDYNFYLGESDVASPL